MEAGSWFWWSVEKKASLLKANWILESALSMTFHEISEGSFNLFDMLFWPLNCVECDYLCERCCWNCS